MLRHASRNAAPLGTGGVFIVGSTWKTGVWACAHAGLVEPRRQTKSRVVVTRRQVFSMVLLPPKPARGGKSHSGSVVRKNASVRPDEARRESCNFPAQVPRPMTEQQQSASA